MTKFHSHVEVRLGTTLIHVPSGRRGASGRNPNANGNVECVDICYFMDGPGLGSPAKLLTTVVAYTKAVTINPRIVTA